jgi:eukaryotic-like serine/threonine-protein kinase
MSLDAGTRLGPYEINGPIGSGGMGDVYRARDTRLGRDVAIKVLPAAMAGDPDRQARFEREARAVASLNHPHICAIYDVGRQAAGSGASIEFLVMELLEGETLAERLARRGGRSASSAGPAVATPRPRRGSSSGKASGSDAASAGAARGRALPLDETLRIATQLAEALGAAHRTGIVHRDLKPSNVMLTRTGVKVLDFGLAKLHEPSPAASVEYATATAPLTDIGVVMGTMPYMAPEQVQGHDVDARADLFAFGAILYEMVTGERAFAADSQAGLIAALLDQQPPPITTVIASAPRSIERVAQRCLEKDPDDRWQSAQDLAAELKWIDQSLRQPESGAVPVVAPAASRQWMFTAAGIVLAAAVFLTLFLVDKFAQRETPAVTAAPTIHSRVRLPDGVALSGWGAPIVSLSPDGRILAFVGRKTGVAKLFVHRLDRDQTVEVPDSATAEGPFFSPDAQWVGFAVGVSGGGLKGELKKYSLATGLTQPISEIGDFFGGAWRADGTIFFMGSQGAHLQKVRADGGTPEPAVVAIRSTGRNVATYGYFPQLLPDGRILMMVETDDGDGRPGILNVDTGEVSVLDPVVSNVRYVGSGHLLYIKNSAMMAVPFDVRTGRVTGAEVAVLSGVSIAGNRDAVFAFSDSGVLAYSIGALAGSRWVISTFVRITNGTVTPLPFDAEYVRTMKASADGNLLAVNTQDTSTWIYDLRRQTRTRLPEAGVRYRLSGPVWSPDHKRVAFFSAMVGWHLYLQPVDGVSPPEVALRGPEEKTAPVFTPDGQSVVFAQHGGGNVAGMRLVRHRLGASGPAERLTKSMFAESNPAFSPDGKWLAYSANDTGRPEVYVQPYPELNRRVQVSRTGGGSPRWSADSRTLFYNSGASLLAVPISGTAATVTIGEPREVMNIPGIRGAEPLTDGSFVALKTADVADVTELRLVVNWFDELRRIAPPK